MALRGQRGGSQLFSAPGAVFRLWKTPMEGRGWGGRFSVRFLRAVPTRWQCPPAAGAALRFGGGGEVEVRPQGSLPRNAGIVNIIITIIIRIVILMVVAFPARFPRGAVPVDAHRGCGVWDCPTMGMPHNPMGVLRF